MVLPADVFHHRTPVSVKSCRLEMAVQFGDIDVLYFRIFDDEVFVELFAHIVVRNAEYGVHPVGPSDCEQAVVVEQTLEHVRFNQSVRRERRLHLTESEAVLRHLKNDALAVSVEFVEADELVELVVVGGSVAVEHLFGSLAMIDVIAEIVADHVGVVHLRICFNRPPAETVSVIPRLHLGNQSVLVGLQRPHALIVPNHLPHLRFAESEHHVEVRVEGERGRDVVAARDVVHRDGAYSHHEDAVEHTLVLLEHAPVESLGMGHRVIDLLALDVEHHIGEVVVFIDDEIELPFHSLCVEVDYVQLADECLLPEHLGQILWRIERFIPSCKVLRYGAAIDIEALRQRLYVSSDP